MLFRSARPGRRAPHVELERAGKPISTIDLFGDGFVLLAGPNGQAWAAAAKQLHIQAHVVGDDIRDPDGQWCDKYGIGADGAVLVRPDGYVGFAGAATDTAGAASYLAAIAR